MSFRFNFVPPFIVYDEDRGLAEARKGVETMWRAEASRENRNGAPCRSRDLPVISPWRRLGFLLLGGLACALYTANAMAGSSAVAGEHVELVAAETSHGGAPVLVGVHMKLRDGWKTYWRTPGDSGLAPRFDWSRSENVATIDLRWPAPRRFDVPDDITFGYKGEVVWPVLVMPADAARPVTLRLAMSYGVCSDICVPGEADLSLTIPSTSEARATAAAPLVRAFFARVPSPPADAGAISARFEAAPVSRLLVRYAVEAETPALIVEGPPGAWFGIPEATRRDAAVDYAVPVELDAGVTLTGAAVTLTFSGATTAVEAKRVIE